MNCTEFKNIINQNDTADLPAELKAHAASCPDCQRVAQLNERLSAGLSILARTARPPNLEQKILQKIASAKPTVAKPAADPSWSDSLFSWLGLSPQLALGVTAVVALIGIAALFLPARPNQQAQHLAPAEWLVQANAGGATIAGQTAAQGPLSTTADLSFEVPAGAELTLTWNQESQVHLQEARGRLSPKSLALERGSVRISSRQPHKTSALEVKTPYGTIREIGTIYLVEVNTEQALVRVEEGKVIVDTGKESRQIGPGESATLNREGIVPQTAQTVVPPANVPVDRVPTPDE